MSKYNATRVQDKEGGHKHHHFDEHKVRVLIPRQNDNKAVDVMGETVTPPKVKSQEHFTVTRHVINLDFNKSGAEKLDPPASIRVEVTRDDIQPGKTPADLRLAYWDDATDKWVVFNTDKHNFRHTKATGAGQSEFLEAEIAKWGDPPISIGHIPPTTI